MKFLPVFLATEFAYGTVGEKLALCGRMLLTGMGTVFLVLCILWGVIAVFGAVAGARTKREMKRSAGADEAVSPADNGKSVSAADAPLADEPEEDDGVLVAVITAAIEAYRASEGAPAGSYRVVSFRRKTTRKSWNGAGPRDN